MSGLLALAEIDPVPPPLGEPLLDHVEEFEEFDGVFDTIRDTVNAGLRELNHLPGVQLPTLPEESLEELLVLPFSGDYRRIRQSADACRLLSVAMHDWSGNVRRLSVSVLPSWQGAAAAACAGRLLAWSVACDGAATVIAQGQMAFEALANFVERVAVEVERLLVELAHVLERLAQRIATKLAGLGGAVSTVIDIARHGTHVVTDLIDDVHLVLDLIDRVRGLVGDVRGFVDQTRGALAGFDRLHNLVGDVLTGGGLPVPLR